MQLQFIDKAFNIILDFDPIIAYKIAKNIKNNKLKEKSKTAIKANLIKMKYGSRNFVSFSSEDQKIILKSLQCLEEGLLDFLDEIKKPD